MLADYNIQLHHRAGPMNRADELSRRPDYDNGKEDNKEVTPLPTALFIKSTTLDHLIKEYQDQNPTEVEEGKEGHLCELINGLWRKDGRTFVPNDTLRWEVLKECHDHPMARHPGVASTFFMTQKNYWWPHQKEFVRSYVKGCATCQQNKMITKPQKPPLFPITPEINPGPFTTISIDWITKLPISKGWDSILTITDHDCSKAVIFVPCKETMGTEELAKQYFKWVFPHYGIPNKIISDRDPQVMLDLAKAICKEGNIWQNISTAYHPQTDGQSE